MMYHLDVSLLKSIKFLFSKQKKASVHAGEKKETATISVPKYNNFLIFQTQIFSSLTVDGKTGIKIDNIKMILIYS